MHKIVLFNFLISFTKSIYKLIHIYIWYNINVYQNSTQNYWLNWDNLFGNNLPSMKCDLFASVYRIQWLIF